MKTEKISSKQMFTPRSGLADSARNLPDGNQTERASPLSSASDDSEAHNPDLLV
jgi:hypothetical protein